MQENKILSILSNTYGINFRKIELLRKGGCISYMVFSENDKFFVKAISSAFMDTAKQSLNILLYLEQKEFPSPCIILTKGGFPYVEIEGTIFVLLSAAKNIIKLNYK